MQVFTQKNFKPINTGQKVKMERECLSADGPRSSMQSYRHKGKMQQQLPASQERAKAHIQYEIDTCPFKSDHKAVKKVENLSRENDNEPFERKKLCVS